MAGVPPEDWQSARTTVVGCNKYMLDNQLHCDVTFRVGRDRTPIKAHSYVLMSRSCVFYDMLTMESADEHRDIEIPDVEPPVFTQLLEFLYCEKTSVDSTNVLSILHCAKKFSVVGLVQKCMECLKQSMKPDRLTVIMESAHSLADEDLRTKCLAKIVLDPLPVFNDDSVSKLCSECLSDIIKYDSLPLLENDVFECLLKYARHKCTVDNVENTPENLRLAVGNAINFIRFPIMSSEYFTETVEPTGLLTTKQSLTLYRYFARNRTGDTAGFETKERTPMLNVGRFKNIGSGWGYKRNKMDAIVFQCSRDILLKGIQVYGTDQGPGQLAINVRLIQESHRANLATKNVILETDGKRKVYNIFFDEARHITKEIKYSIELIVNGPTTFYGVDGKTRVECDAVQFTFSKSDKGTNPTDVERGQVPGMVFQVSSEIA
ncbi:BTB/POZ domain-containing protein 2-like [Dreissena polymorpha]|uniref:BTB domain-containing protein n=1 Tax=Dreissena polymorpha TaxID=45954 RepID=A0A9D4DRL0_DREPO|nr:BTB/POZ domain-containing protein 2-like [Dreissena polymorpha]XP_052234947.1 BTB/POZ domain-containing protein 2-like [Dreissena polymorpha]KAH3752539.1 hypothetical protein DPMN_187160 [Dreissena polymorpha]